MTEHDSVELTTDVSYLLYWDEDVIPIPKNMTLGNHLENDLVVPGEDVSDYHARFEMADRGPVLIPLGSSTVNVNGQESRLPIRVMIGDVIGIGQVTMQIGVELEKPSDAESWALHASDGNQFFALSGEVSVGRADSSDIILNDEHISRHHARFVEKHQVVWLQDLHSANGTRINDSPLVGGARLYHGDYVNFDKLRFQLIGRGGDLTPVVHFSNALQGTQQKVEPESPPTETTQLAVVDLEPLTDLPDVDDAEVGAYFLGVSEPVHSTVFRLNVGRTLVGRGAHCEINIQDPTVSFEHAEVSIRPEGATITNLMSTNGTSINGNQVTTMALHDGDVLRLGRIAMVFKDVPPSKVEDHPVFARIKLGVLAATVVIGALLLMTLW